jgi:hypothetical protein
LSPPSPPGAGDRFARAIAAIDAQNSADPHRALRGAREWPQELLHAELATSFLLALEPAASEALRLAARAHHLRRWEIPRARFPAGRAGYHRWRRALHEFHAAALAPLLAAAGYGDDMIGRVQSLVAKQGLGSDPEVQLLEDALCLVFFAAELEAVAHKLEPERLDAVLDRTLRKMSERGRSELTRCSLGPTARALANRALAALS